MITMEPGAGTRGMLNLWVVGPAVVVLATLAINVLGSAGHFCIWRVAAVIALDHRVLRHGAVDVEFGDFWWAHLCLWALLTAAPANG